MTLLLFEQILAICIISMGVFMVMLLVRQEMLDNYQRKQLRLKLPVYMTQGDYLMAEIHVNRSCLNGLNKSSCNAIKRYISKVSNMEIDYIEKDLINVIKNS